MNYLLLPFRAAYKLYYMFCFGFFLVLLYPFFRYFLADEKRYQQAFTVIRFYAQALNFTTLVRMRVQGRRHIPGSGAYVICANHSSYVDIPCLYSLFSRYYVFTGKKEIENWPLFHIFYTSGMNILVDRSNRIGAYRAFKRMIGVLDQGHPLLIFPEGTVSRQAPKLTAFKSGAFAIAIQKQVPVLPVTFLTNWKRMQRASFLWGKGSPGFADVVVHEPVSTAGMTQNDVNSLRQRVREIINEPLKNKYNFV